MRNEEGKKNPDQSNLLETAAHLIAETLGTAGKSLTLMKHHLPGSLHYAEQAAEVCVEILKDDCKEPLEKGVCSALASSTKIATNASVTVGLAMGLVLAPELELPLIGAVLGATARTLTATGLGVAMQHAASSISEPIGEIANETCHATFDLFKKDKEISPTQQNQLCNPETPSDPPRYCEIPGYRKKDTAKEFLRLLQEQALHYEKDTTTEDVTTTYPTPDDIWPASASLLSAGTKIRNPIVSHATDAALVDSILQGINLKSHKKNQFGGKAFYVAEEGYAAGEATGDRLVAFSRSRKMKIFDIFKFNSPMSLEKRRVNLPRALKHLKFDAIQFEGSTALQFNEKKLPSKFSYNLAIINHPELLKPIAVYPVPENVCSISMRSIRFWQGAGILGATFGLVHAGKEIIESYNPGVETLHQASLLGAAYAGGMKAGVMAIKPCAALGAAFPAAAPISVPSCVAVSSIVGGVIAATTADLAWKVGANACRTSSLFSEAQVSSHVPKKPEAKKSKGNTKTHNALLRVASTPTTATSYEEFSNTQLNRKIIETLLVEDTAEKDIERHSTLKISTAFEVVNSWLDDESIPTETRLNYANVLAKSTHSHLSTVSDGMYDIHLIAFTDKLNDTAEEIKALQLNLNEKKLTLSEFKHAFKKQVDASDKTTRDFINEKPKDPLSLENLLERFNNTAESEKQLHLMRDELITAIEEISGDEEALRAKADLITQRYKFEEIKSNAHLLTTGASSLAVIFGHPEWANKISAVGHGSVSITESILALAGSSLVSITSPMAIVGILSSIASITQAFSPQYQDPTPQLTLEAVQELSRQLARLEDKIYYHFQEQKLEHKETYRKTLEHFSQLHTSNAIQLSMTRQFYMSIQARFDQQESQLNSLPQLIHAMSERMIYAAYDTQHNDLIECMNFIEAMTETAETNYLENATKILTIGLHNSIGSQPSSPMDIPSLPVSPNSYLHFSTYFAQLMHTFGLSNCNTKFADPYLATTAALVALLLDIKQFPDPNHPHEHLRINEKSVNRLLEYLSMLTRISNLMIQSREPAFFENVLAAWRKATLQLDSEIRVAFRSIIKERQHFYQQELGVVLDIQRAMIEEGFINTHIEPSVQELFTGTIKRWKRRHHGRTWDVRGNEHVGSYIDEEAKNAFLIPLKSQINQQKIIAKEDSVTRQLVVSENKMSVDGHWAITHYHGIKYIKPNEPGLPYLPAPDPLFSQEAVPAFLKTLLKAQTFSVGELQLTYDIDLATSTFHLHLEMQCLDDTRQHLTSQRIATFTRPYAPLYAQGAEAVWYFWLGGSLPRSNTKIAKHRLIDATLMHGGWFPLFAERTGQEMCDFAWQHHGGGLLGHDGGEFEFTQVSYFINDACVDFPATKDIFVTMSEAALPPNVTLTVYPEPLQIISDLMKTQETRFKNDCADRLSQTLRGKNFKQYELSFRNLYGILSWSYYNTLQNPDSRLSKCFSQTVFNLDEICNKNTASIREGNPLISSYNSLKNLAEISAELRETLKDPEFGLPDPNCAFLTEAARQINAFLALYLPNCLAGDQMATLSKANEIAMTLIVETLASILQEQHSEAGQRILMGMAKKVEELIATSKPADRTLFVEMLRSKLPTKAISWTGGLFRIKNASEAAPSQEHHTSHTQ